MVTEVEGKEKIEPKFRNPKTMTEEELTDPDYALKQLAKQYGLNPDEVIVCSKCHHCR